MLTPEPAWAGDIAARLNQATDAIAAFQARITTLNLLRAQLLSARDGTLPPQWRAELVAKSEEIAEQQPAVGRAAADIAALPVADWEPDRDLGWRTALESWFDAIKACIADAERCEMDLRTQAGVVISDRAVAVGAAVDLDLVTASYRAGLAAGGLDVDWFDWLIERVHSWPDKRRRDDQLDLMTRDPSYRRSSQQLPNYWR